AGTYDQKSRTFHTPDQFAALTRGAVSIYRSVDPDTEITVRRLPVHLPNTEFTVTALRSRAVLWIGTRNGAIRLPGDHQPLDYFSGPRWLPDAQRTLSCFDHESE